MNCAMKCAADATCINTCADGLSADTLNAFAVAGQCVHTNCTAPATCGDGKCNGSETSGTCPADCGPDKGCTATASKGCGGCSCEVCVCKADSYCCDNAWDSSCVIGCKDCGTVCK